MWVYSQSVSNYLLNNNMSVIGYILVTMALIVIGVGVILKLVPGEAKEAKEHRLYCILLYVWLSIFWPIVLIMATALSPFVIFTLLVLKAYKLLGWV